MRFLDILDGTVKIDTLKSFKNYTDSSPASLTIIVKLNNFFRSVLNKMATGKTAELTVYIDVKSPYAFIALEPTLALEHELGLQFDWIHSHWTYQATLVQLKKMTRDKSLKIIEPSHNGPVSNMPIKMLDVTRRCKIEHF